jgi:guanylate kinase
MSAPQDPARRGRMLLISGPSGSGKSTICRRLKERPEVVFSVSATTRAPRTGEVDGVDYRFVSPAQFRELQSSGAFIEHAEVHGNMYGTLKAPMEEAIARGQVYLVEIDVQGAMQLKRLEVPGVYVFVDVPDLRELRRRLEARGTDSPAVIDRRVAKAEAERAERDKYDVVVTNDDLERAYGEVLRAAGLDRRDPRGGMR